MRCGIMIRTVLAGAEDDDYVLPKSEVAAQKVDEDDAFFTAKYVLCHCFRCVQWVNLLVQ